MCRPSWRSFLKVEPTTINGLMMALVAASAPLYVLFGWLSDKVGRKPVLLFGMTLMLAAFYFPRLPPAGPRR